MVAPQHMAKTLFRWDEICKSQLLQSSLIWFLAVFFSYCSPPSSLQLQKVAIPKKTIKYIVLIESLKYFSTLAYTSTLCTAMAKRILSSNKSKRKSCRSNKQPKKNSQHVTDCNDIHIWMTAKMHKIDCCCAATQMQIKCHLSNGKLLGKNNQQLKTNRGNTPAIFMGHTQRTLFLKSNSNATYVTVKCGKSLSSKCTHIQIISSMVFKKRTSHKVRPTMLNDQGKMLAAGFE